VFAGSGPAQTNVLGFFEAAFAVDHSMDPGIRKNEAILSRVVG
jgi:hypothetical protein